MDWEAKMGKEVKTVGAKEGLGAGIIGLGLIIIFLPSAVQKIADMGIGETYPMLSGTVMVFGIFVVIAGLSIIFMKLSD